MLPCYNHISERINFHFMLMTQTQATAETTAVWRGRKHDYQIVVVMVPVGCNRAPIIKPCANTRLMMARC